MKRICFGCGSKPMQDCMNVDKLDLIGVDIVYDFNNLPFPFENEQFDEVHFPNSIHCCNNLKELMKEVNRILKPEGMVFIESVVFLSPITHQDMNEKTLIGFNTFDQIKGFEVIDREWIFSKNKYLKWLSFIPNIFPKLYSRMFYFYFPSNSIQFILKKK